MHRAYLGAIFSDPRGVANARAGRLHAARFGEGTVRVQERGTVHVAFKRRWWLTVAWCSGQARQVATLLAS